MGELTIQVLYWVSAAWNGGVPSHTQATALTSDLFGAAQCAGAQVLLLSYVYASHAYVHHLVLAAFLVAFPPLTHSLPHSLTQHISTSHFPTHHPIKLSPLPHCVPTYYPPGNRRLPGPRAPVIVPSQRSRVPALPSLPHQSTRLPSLGLVWSILQRLGSVRVFPVLYPSYLPTLYLHVSSLPPPTSLTCPVPILRPRTSHSLPSK